MNVKSKYLETVVFEELFEKCTNQIDFMMLANVISTLEQLVGIIWRNCEDIWKRTNTLIANSFWKASELQTLKVNKDFQNVKFIITRIKFFQLQSFRSIFLIQSQLECDDFLLPTIKQLPIFINHAESRTQIIQFILMSCKKREMTQSGSFSAFCPPSPSIDDENKYSAI